MTQLSCVPAGRLSVRVLVACLIINDSIYGYSVTFQYMYTKHKDPGRTGGKSTARNIYYRLVLVFDSVPNTSYLKFSLIFSNHSYYPSVQDRTSDGALCLSYTYTHTRLPSAPPPCSSQTGCPLPIAPIPYPRKFLRRLHWALVGV